MATWLILAGCLQLYPIKLNETQPNTKETKKLKKEEKSMSCVVIKLQLNPT